MGDEELWYEQRFLPCYIVAVFLHCGYKLQVQDGSGYNNYSPKAKGVLLVIFYKRIEGRTMIIPRKYLL